MRSDPYSDNMSPKQGYSRTKGVDVVEEKSLKNIVTSSSRLKILLAAGVHPCLQTLFLRFKAIQIYFKCNLSHVIKKSRLNLLQTFEPHGL